MIYGFIHPGSGLGNQLHRYVAIRTLALDKGYDFAMIGRGYFKGDGFMDLDLGTFSPDMKASVEQGGKIVVQEDMPLWEEGSTHYNPEFNFIEDNTLVDGEFQDERYFGHRLDEINEWLKVDPIEIPDDVCVIGFRGGEFYTVPELGLPPTYYEEGIRMMKEINPDMKFEVHTDDPTLAQRFFPDFRVIHNVGVNWRSVRCAKYAIIANSSFYIFPRLLRHHQGKYMNFDFQMVDDNTTTIAPRYWDRYNIKKWERPYNYYKAFAYI